MWFKGADEFKDVMGYEVATEPFVNRGEWLPRVTKILEVKNKSGLDQFFKEMESYSAVQDVKTRSAEEGTRVHEVIQGHMTGEITETPEDMRHIVDAFDVFNQKHGIIFHPEFVERRIWSGFHRFAGTVDALASIGDKFGVLDIKTSTGFFPEYNLQTAAYVLALQEVGVKRALALPRDIETRWILRIDQNRTCNQCGSKLREKGGRTKIRPARRSFSEGGNGKSNSTQRCIEDQHDWGAIKGEIEIKEFPYFYRDIKAFLAAKTLWEWEHDYWLKQVGYLK